MSSRPQSAGSAPVRSFSASAAWTAAQAETTELWVRVCSGSRPPGYTRPSMPLPGGTVPASKNQPPTAPCTSGMPSSAQPRSSVSRAATLSSPSREAAAAQQPGAVVLRHELRHGLKADLRRDKRRPLLSRSGLALTYAQRRREQLAVEVALVKHVPVRRAYELRAEPEHVLQQPAAEAAQPRYENSACQKRQEYRPLCSKFNRNPAPAQEPLLPKGLLWIYTLL